MEITIILLGIALLILNLALWSMSQRLSVLDHKIRLANSRLDAGAALWKTIELERIPELERRVSALDDPFQPPREP